MSFLPKLGSLVALGATILPAFLFYAGSLDQDAVKWLTLGGTIGWFIATPLWMERRKETTEEVVVP